MHRRLVVFGLIAAVLIAAIGLTYYSYRNTPSERLVVLDTMRELAAEKMIGIQTEVTNAAIDMFEKVDPDRLSALSEQLKESTLLDVIVLDEDKSLMVDGFRTKRSPAEDEPFQRLFRDRVIPDLDLDSLAVEERRSLHTYYDGKPYLFSYTRRVSHGRFFFIVVDTDMTFLVATVLPNFLDTKAGRHVYQVVDRSGPIYGLPFSGGLDEDVIELPFHAPLTQWRLRVAPREANLLASRASRRATLDIVLITTALAVILAGFVVMLFAMQRERRLNELKSEFISNVSHELKTPLSIISMFGELLSMGRTRSPAQATEYAEIIRRESVRLSRLIDSVLDFSKIERGVGVYEFADEQDLGEVVRRALDISRHRLEQAKMELEVDLAADLPLLRIDTNAMTVAVLNLVDNAIKYAADGKRIQVRLGRAHGAIALEVQDFGPGVPEDEREQIFERFFRSRTVRLKPIRGSGIGLALVKHIAEAHGGDVGVRPGEGGVGSIFRLWIPARAGA